jgi:hypothetical protein
VLLSLVALGPVARIASFCRTCTFACLGSTCRLRPKLGKHGRKLLVDNTTS